MILPPADGTVTEPDWKVERPEVEAHTYWILVPPETGEDQAKVWLVPTVQVNEIGAEREEYVVPSTVRIVPEDRVPMPV